MWLGFQLFLSFKGDISGVDRTHWNIYDGVFLQKYLTAFNG